METKYYVYFHIDPRTNQVFYVGKGSNNRAWILCKRSEKHIEWIKNLSLNHLKPLIKIAHSFNNEKDALQRERMVISFLLKAGHPLLNRNGGGGGHPGGPSHPNFGKLLKKETKQKISIALKGKLRPDLSEITRKRMIGNTIKRGTKSKEETRLKISKSLFGNQRRSEKIVCLNNGKIYNSIKEAWTELELDERSVFRVLKGEYKHTKGYRFIYR